MKFLKEGFRNQRLVVLPAPVQEAAKSNPLLKGLYVTDAGFFPDAKSHRRERKNGAQGAVLIVCLAGRGWVKIGSGASRVQQGDVILIAPKQSHSYGADVSQAWTIVWAHINGEELDFWWKLLALPREGGILTTKSIAPEQLELGRVHEQLESGYDEARQIAAAAALRWSLAQLAGSGSDHSAQNHDMEGVATWMREHVSHRISIAELSRRAGLSPAHFFLRFKQHTGFAPIDYFLRLKVRRACGMLDGTTWSVARIARELGYEDAFYFSRLFRSIMGCCPKAYRNHPKG